MRAILRFNSLLSVLNRLNQLISAIFGFMDCKPSRLKNLKYSRKEKVTSEKIKEKEE
jgi:hypothetical protein